MGLWKRTYAATPNEAVLEGWKSQYTEMKRLYAATSEERDQLRAQLAERDREDAEAEREDWIENDEAVANYNAAIAKQSARLLASDSNNVMVALEAIARLTEARDQHIAKNAPKIPCDPFVGAWHTSDTSSGLVGNRAMNQVYDDIMKQLIRKGW